MQTTLTTKKRYFSSSTKSILVWGRGDHGQLGLGQDVREKPLPTLINIPFQSEDDILSINCGMNHTIIRTRREELFSFGVGDMGQLGHGNNQHVYTPKRIESPVLKGKRIARIACGGHHTLCSTVDVDGQPLLYAWGRNANGELGLSSSDKTVPNPTEVKAFRGKNIVSMACGEDFSVVVTDTDVWTFGINDVHQLGRSDSSKIAPIIQVKGETVLGVSSGWGHTALVTNERLITWGANLHSQCGRGTKSTSLPIGVVDSLSQQSSDMVEQVSCGSSHTMWRTHSGKVYLAGSSADGKMGPVGHAPGSDVLTPMALRFQDTAHLYAKSVISGCDHMFVLTEGYQESPEGLKHKKSSIETNKQALWGWGFGQHGVLTDKNMGIVSQPILIPIPSSYSQWHNIATGMDVTFAIVSSS